MDEKDARSRLIAEFDVPRETMDRVENFIALLVSENGRQNLVSRGTLSSVWSRHILDSAQLLRFAPPEGSWLDLGTGAGFPGLIIALLRPEPVVLVEERRKRAEFLAQAADELGISHKLEIHATNIERLESRSFDVISARAFAPLERLLHVSHSFSTAKTRWILPKGRNAASELEASKASWHGDFRLEQSITDADAKIIVAEGVTPKAAGRIAQGKGSR